MPSAEQPVGPAVSYAEPATRPAATTLEGRFVRLTPPNPGEDAADLFPVVSGPENAALWTYLFNGPFASEEALSAEFAKTAGLVDPVFFAIRDAATGRALGRASYMRIEPNHRVIEVGSILFSPLLQRTPAATEAMYLMARHVFEDLGYRRYEWKCDALNAPSRAAAVRFGFRFEGVFRKHMIVKSRSRDTAWFAMTDDEWPRVKAAFERWLEPANFDAEGRQTRRLEEIRAKL
ncbi:GNAT family N-acetyltransferase [Methylopila sp. Yamaguchi]|uniref:GNAT family N-acetyltransferase n=1 Tax=Methylopila sp. Yamaguchi TaxID=1437817 RepID=UPI000CCC2DC6|nr:GNAT family protein [Methylopila sp. Yamaguchi]